MTDKEKILHSLKAIKKNKFFVAEKLLKNVLYSKAARKIEEIKEDVISQLNEDAYSHRKLSEIAKDILTIWKNAPNTATEYLNEMSLIDRKSVNSESRLIVNALINEMNKSNNSKLLPFVEELSSILETCCCNKKKRMRMGEADEDFEDEVKNPPKKVGKKYFLKDNADEEWNEDAKVIEESDNLIGDTDDEGELRLMLRNKWFVLLDRDAPYSDASGSFVKVRYRGVTWGIKYLGKQPTKGYLVEIGKYDEGADKFISSVTLTGKSLTELFNKVLVEILKR